MEGSMTGVVSSPQPGAGDRTSKMPPIAHCVAFCVAFGLVFAVSGVVLLSSGLPYRRLQLRIISACMLVMGVVLLAAAVVLIFMWRNRHHFGAFHRSCHRRQQRAALVIRVPTVSGTYVYSPTPAGAAAGAAPSRPPPPAYEEVVPPPPSYESVMMLKRLEKAAELAHQVADSARRGSAPAAADV